MILLASPCIIISPPNLKVVPPPLLQTVHSKQCALHVRYQKEEGSENVIPIVLESFPGKIKFICKKNEALLPYDRC